MDLNGAQIMVVGAGIAGLAVARALAQRGAIPRVAEQAAGIGEVGAGLQLSPNGVAVLDALGLGDAVRRVAIAARAVELRDYRAGRRVVRLDLRDRPYLFVHRARLIEVLEAGARDAGVDIALNARVSPPDKAVIKAASAKQEAKHSSTDLMIGADGVRSWVRSAINGEAEPFFTGQVAWRAVIADGDTTPEARVYMGPGRHLVSYPLAGGLRNIVAVEERTAWTAEGWAHEDTPDTLRHAFRGFAPQVLDWLARVERVHLWGLFRHPVARHWYGGHYAILGDAAHPTLPFLAQGANLALEDAWVLARCLADLPMPDALAAYQDRRRPRAERVIAAANANARNYHLRFPPVRFAAHGALRLAGAVTPGALLGRFDWLYGHDVTRE